MEAGRQRALKIDDILRARRWEGKDLLPALHLFK